MRSIKWQLGLIVATSLACGLDFSAPSLKDVTLVEANDAGYTLPAGATHIYVHDFSSIDVRSTRFRFNLPQDQLDDLIAQHQSSPQYTTHIPTQPPPASWPDFHNFGDDAVAPDWWMPTGDVAFRRSTSADLSAGGTDMGSGSLILLDSESLAVHQWKWEWQWWKDTSPSK